MRDSSHRIPDSYRQIVYRVMTRARKNKDVDPNTTRFLRLVSHVKRMVEDSTDEKKIRRALVDLGVM